MFLVVSDPDTQNPLSIIYIINDPVSVNGARIGANGIRRRLPTRRNVIGILPVNRDLAGRPSNLTDVDVSEYRRKIYPDVGVISFHEIHLLFMIRQT